MKTPKPVSLPDQAASSRVVPIARDFQKALV